MHHFPTQIPLVTQHVKDAKTIKNQKLVVSFVTRVHHENKWKKDINWMRI